MIEEINKSLRNNKIKRVVLWGVNAPIHSHHYIHKGFFDVLQKLNINVQWFHDSKFSQNKLQKDDLIITVNIASKFLPIRNDVKYVFHNFEKIDLDEKKYISLQVITKSTIIEANSLAVKFNGNSWYFKKKNLLVQAWGTPILKENFLEPFDNRRNKYEFFIGSIWNNSLNQGNIEEIKIYKKVIDNLGKKFVHGKYIPDWLMRQCVLSSPLSMSIIGKWQEENGYLPCRLFKGISLGKVGLINSRFANGILELNDQYDSIENSIEKYMIMNSHQYNEIVRYHQLQISNETYAHKILNILKAFDLKLE